MKTLILPIFFITSMSLFAQQDNIRILVAGPRNRDGKIDAEALKVSLRNYMSERGIHINYIGCFLNKKSNLNGSINFTWRLNYPDTIPSFRYCYYPDSKGEYNRHFNEFIDSVQYIRDQGEIKFENPPLSDCFCPDLA